jgi:hypothetical protein
MQDKTAIENNQSANTPSKAFLEYIESLVEEIVINNAVFNDHKKYLQRYSHEEGVDYVTLEKNLTEFFETVEELKSKESKASERLARILAKEIFLSETQVNRMIDTILKKNKENNRNGFSIVCFSDGDRYEGNWKDGKMSGQGTFCWANSGDKYVGNWQDGKMNGQGIMYYADGSKYEGGWKDNNKHGQGICYWSDSGDRYEGEWKDGKMNGLGIIYYADGTRYEGNLKDNIKEGQGKLFWTNGDRFEGHWLHNVINGSGKYYWPNGTRFEGVWKDGHRNGPGTVYWNTGDKDSGNVVDEKRDGEWLRIKVDGKKQKATYKNGEIVTDWHFIN